MSSYPLNISRPVKKLNIMDAIYGRHAVRSYLPQPVDRAMIETLLKAAVQAPTAMHEEPWAFMVVQDKDSLRLINDIAKQTKQEDLRNLHFEAGSGGAYHRVTPQIDALHGAGTLIVIYSELPGPFVDADCWLAAQNIMLAACSLGLGSCVVGMSIAALNDPNVKKEFRIPEEMRAIVPIIIGHPDGSVSPTERKEPFVLSWI